MFQETTLFIHDVFRCEYNFPLTQCNRRSLGKVRAMLHSQDCTGKSDC